MSEDVYRLTEPWNPEIGWRPPEYLMQTLWGVVGELGNLTFLAGPEAAWLTDEQRRSMVARAQGRLADHKLHFMNELNGLWNGDPGAVDTYITSADPTCPLLQSFGPALGWVVGDGSAPEMLPVDSAG